MAANTFLTTQQLTQETLLILTNNLKAAAHCHRGYDSEYGQKGAKIGATLNIRKPVRFKGRQGQAFNPEGVQETTVPLTLSFQAGVDFEMSSVERKLSVDYLRDRILKPAAVTIANQIDATVLYLAYQAVAQNAGTPGTIPVTSLVYLTMPQIIHEMGFPVDDETCILISPQMQAYAVDSFKTLFHDGGQLSGQYKSGKMGTAWGMEWYEDQQIFTHTIGTYSGSPVVHGANQTGNTLITNGWGSGVTTLNVGDCFTIAGVYAVNPQPGSYAGGRQQYNRLQPFVVTATVSDTAGAITIPISPPIIPSGQYQNVSSVPADNATIVVFGASGTVTPQGLAFHKSAFAIASVPLEEPQGSVEETFTETDPDTGVSLRYVRQYVATTDQYVNRFDVLWGFVATYPEGAVRISS